MNDNICEICSSIRSSLTAYYSLFYCTFSTLNLYEVGGKFWKEAKVESNEN